LKISSTPQFVACTSPCDMPTGISYWSDASAFIVASATREG